MNLEHWHAIASSPFKLVATGVYWHRHECTGAEIEFHVHEEYSLIERLIRRQERKLERNAESL